MTLRILTLRTLATLPLPFLLAGCGISAINPNTTAHGVSLHGSVHGGQQPINGAHVYLLAANVSGYGNPSQSLLDGSVTGFSDSIGGYVPTGPDGSWDISGTYTCTPNSQVYLYALGGDPGAGINTAAGLMAVLGNCPGSGTFAATVPWVSMNEVTTVAAAYAMSGYAVDALHVASSGTPLALTGIANAFANAGNLADLPSGTTLATTPNGNGAVPQAQINLLANVAAECINSTGPGSSACTTLLGDATSDGTPGGTSPTDTATALINIAHNPGANVADLFNLPSPAAPFAPSQATQPNDLTISLQFTGASMHSPSSVAFDAQGNAWVTNQNSNSVTVLSSLGVPAANSPFSNNGVNAPTQVSIDTHGNAWIANGGGTTVSEFDSFGNAVLGSPFSLGGADVPDALAIDAAGDVWTANPTSNDLTVLASGGGMATITGNGLASPYGIAFDQTGNAWVANESANSVTILNNSGAALVNSPVMGAGLNTPVAISIDGAGNAWIANIGGNSLTVLDHTGAPVSGSPFSGGGISLPIATAVDGGGNVWVANSDGSGVTELTGTGAAVAGSPFVANGLATPYFVAVDGAGSVWLANVDGDSLTEIIGSATPAVTPMTTALTNGAIGSRP